ncbi:hypothetical protein QYF36_020401 [Acer negundo]|nr:hypothetical protein QYF36_020401 [Acer negundo]
MRGRSSSISSMCGRRSIVLFPPNCGGDLRSPPSMFLVDGLTLLLPYSLKKKEKKRKGSGTLRWFEVL